METVAEKEESKFTTLQKRYEAEMNKWTWFKELPPFERGMLITEMAGAACEQYFKGWWEGHSNCYDSLTKRA